MPFLPPLLLQVSHWGGCLRTTNWPDWLTGFWRVKNGCVGTSEPHLRLYLFMFSCPSADSSVPTRVGCSCTGSSVLMYFYLSSFLCWVISCLFICMLRGSVSIAACRGVHGSSLKENKILMDQWKHFTWNLNNCSVKEAFHANPVSHLLSGNDLRLNPGRVLRGS